MAYFKITKADLKGHLTNSPSVGKGYLFHGTEKDDTFIIDVTASDLKGRWIGVVGLGGNDSMTTTPRFDDDAPFALFYGDEQGAGKTSGNDRIDLTAGNQGRSGPGADGYFLHPGDYKRKGPAVVFADIRTDDVFLADDDNMPEVTGFRFAFIEKRGDMRIGHLESVTVEGETRNPLTDGMKAKIMLGVEREGPRPDHVVTWQKGEGARDAVEDFVLGGVGEWLFL